MHRPSERSTIDMVELETRSEDVLDQEESRIQVVVRNTVTEELDRLSSEISSSRREHPGDVEHIDTGSGERRVHVHTQRMPRAARDAHETRRAERSPAHTHP